MIKRNGETGSENRRVSSFKKFSELDGSKIKDNTEDASSSIIPDGEDRPGLPNLPYNKTKVEKPISTKSMMPKGEDIDDEDDESNESVEFIGKVAKMPKGVKASKGLNFLENVKVSKSSIWYLMIERQDNELQMVKYNHKKGVDLGKFINDLKSYYISKYSNNKKVCQLIESIAIDGNDKYSWVKNIPLIEVDGKKMISRITEDLIRLLSK